MEIYEYTTYDGLTKFGLKIWEDDNKLYLSYEAAGFNSRQEAENRYNEFLNDLLEK